MVVAMKPDLEVMLIRDGSLLDDESLILLGEFAEENKFQIWLERVANSCPACKGTGRRGPEEQPDGIVLDEPCPRCHGTGYDGDDCQVIIEDGQIQGTPVEAQEQPVSAS